MWWCVLADLLLVDILLSDAGCLVSVLFMGILLQLETEGIVVLVVFDLR
jgi:hypothetical protein